MNKQSGKKTFFAGLAVLLASIAAAPSVTAQETGQEASRTQDVLEEVLVTARKREESLSDVPMSISAITGEQIQTSAIANLEDMAASVPNFTFTEAVSGNDQIFIRGIGSGVNTGFENAVGQVLNGFFFGRSRMGRGAFLDIQQVEILKGPQGALIGKNTTAGAVNIRFRMPTDEFEGYISPSYEFEADEGYSVEGAVSGPFSDAVRGRIAFRYDDRDGWLRNFSTGGKPTELEDVTIRGILDFDLTPNLNGNIIYQYDNANRIDRNREIGICSASLVALLGAGSLEDCRLNYTKASIRRENGVVKDERTDTESRILGLTLNWDLGPVTVTSLSGYAGYESNDIWDGDQIPLDLSITGIDEDYDQWSEEMRILSNTTGPLEYIAGFYYAHTELDSQFTVDLLGPARKRVIQTQQETDTYSLFGQATWRFNEQWDLAVGLRYTDEKKDAHQIQYPAVSLTLTPIIPVPVVGPLTNVHDITARLSENDWSPNTVLRWHPNDDAMLYASFSRGFKGGGFDHQMDRPQATAAAGFEFNDEAVDAYELGGKFTFADGTAQLNVALFHSKFDDLQVGSLIPGTVVFQVGNAASAITQGVEADLTWRPMQNLRLFATAAYLDAEYDKFKDAPCYILQTTGCTGAGSAAAQDLSGTDLLYSPKFAFTINGKYTWPVMNNYEISLFTQVVYTDSFQTATDNDPHTIQDSYYKIDATLSLEPLNGRWQISLIGRNLNDELTYSFANDSSGSPAHAGSYFYFVESPRAIALQARINF